MTRTTAGGPDQRDRRLLHQHERLGPILNRPVIYTPIPLPSVYCGVNSAVAAVAALAAHWLGSGDRPPHRRRVVGDRCAQHHLQRAAPFLEPIVVGGLPRDDAEQFHTFVADALRDPERQMCGLEQRSRPFRRHTARRTIDGSCRWPAPNGRLSRRLLEAMGLWDQALATGAVFVNPYDPANIADTRRNLADSLSLGFTYTSRLADMLEPAFATRTAAEWERFLAARLAAASVVITGRNGRTTPMRRARRASRRDPRDGGRADRADELDAERAPLRAALARRAGLEKELPDRMAPAPACRDGPAQRTPATGRLHGGGHDQRVGRAELHAHVRRTRRYRDAAGRDRIQRARHPRDVVGRELGRQACASSSSDESRRGSPSSTSSPLARRHRLRQYDGRPDGANSASMRRRWGNSIRAPSACRYRHPRRTDGPRHHDKGYDPSH